MPMKRLYNLYLDLVYSWRWHIHHAPYEGLSLPNGDFIGSNEYLWRRRDKGGWIYKAMSEQDQEDVMWERAIK